MKIYVDTTPIGYGYHYWAEMYWHQKVIMTLPFRTIQRGFREEWVVPHSEGVTSALLFRAVLLAVRGLNVVYVSGGNNSSHSRNLEAQLDGIAGETNIDWIVSAETFTRTTDSDRSRLYKVFHKRHKKVVDDLDRFGIVPEHVRCGTIRFANRGMYPNYASSGEDESIRKWVKNADRVILNSGRMPMWIGFPKLLGSVGNLKTMQSAMLSVGYDYSAPVKKVKRVKHDLVSDKDGYELLYTPPPEF